jgi:hypothetical protein
MVLTLSGKDGTNKWNLTGKNSSIEPNLPIEIKNLKIRIMNTLLLPLLSKQWKIMKNNMFLIDSFKQKINFYYDSFKLEEILLYKEIINLCEIFVLQSAQLEETEKRIYGSNINAKNKQTISLVYETTIIKLKPEYEIYDSIFGKPTRQNKQTYSDDIIIDIQKMMVKDNITYEIMKNYLEKKYT